jgi:hypothetical protein
VKCDTNERRTHPEELMNPDLVSEIVLTGSTLVVVALLFVLWQALT